jgi:hypothetical protein
MNNIILFEGLRMFWQNIIIKTKGFKKFSGTEEEICKNIIDGCYDYKKKYFRASMQNYPLFYSRDFGWIIESLISIGYKKEVKNTLAYVLKIYSSNSRITVAINPSGKPFDFPDIYSPDSVAYMFRSLRVAKAKNLISKYACFLNNEIRRFESEVIDKDKGIVKNKVFSGMRDYAINSRSCYDMTMACMLCEEIRKINKLLGKHLLINTLSKHNLKNNLIKHYWTGKYFRNAIGDNSCTGHANVYPYWLDIITDKRFMKSSLHEMQSRLFDKPLPLKYENKTNPKKDFIALEFFVKDWNDGTNWEYDTVWSMLGMAYIQILSKIDRNSAAKHLQAYKRLIEKYGFIEVYNNDTKPFSSLFYSSDNTMIWAAMYLNYKFELKKIKNINEMTLTKV